MPSVYKRVPDSRWYCDYIQKTLEKCLLEIRSNQMSQRDATSHFRLPRSTIKNKLKNACVNPLVDQEFSLNWKKNISLNTSWSYRITYFQLMKQISKCSLHTIWILRVEQNVSLRITPLIRILPPTYVHHLLLLVLIFQVQILLKLSWSETKIYRSGFLRMWNEIEWQSLLKVYHCTASFSPRACWNSCISCVLL